MCKILVLEDVSDQAEYLCRILEAEGMDVRQVTTAEEALVLADSFDPDLVIADYELRDDTSGLEAILRLRERSPRIEAIMLSGFPERLEGEEALLEHAAPLTMTKPLDLDHFLGIVKRLDRRSHHRHRL